MWIDDIIIKLNSKVKWRISQKLTVLIGLLMISLLIIGISSIYTLQLFNYTFQKTLDLNIKRTLIAGEMNDDLMRFDRLVVEYIRSRYQADRQKIRNELSVINSHFSVSIDNLKQLKQDSTNNALLGELEPSWNEYNQTIQKILAKAQNDQLESAMELWDGWASVRYRDLKYLIKEVIHYNSELAQRSKEKVDRSSGYHMFLIILVIILTSLLSIGLGVLIIRYLQISLRNLVLANEQISQGYLSQGLDLAISYNSQDELAELAESNRKVVESIKKMVEDVTALTEKYGPDEPGLVEELDQKQLTDLMNTEKTLGLVQNLTSALELVKEEIGKVCKSDLIKPGLEEAHQRTLETIDNFNKGIQKIHKVLVNISSIRESFNKLAEQYEPSKLTGDLKSREILKHLAGFTAASVNTMEVIKFGLLDQKMLLDSMNSKLEETDTNNYFANLAKAIKNIIKQAETTGVEAQKLHDSLQQMIQTVNNAQLQDNQECADPAQGENEFKTLLERLEGLLNGERNGGERFRM